MKNSLNNVFTAHHIQVFEHFVFAVMTSLVVFKIAANERKSNISEVI
jgi:hypothetical protein